MTLAYPGPPNATTQIVGRDGFLDALDNGNLRVRILEREPLTLEDALSIACRLEAFDKSAPSSCVNDDPDSSKGRERPRHVRTVAAAASNGQGDNAVCCATIS